ncbi:SDR family NAD(P)-dependent oxidoreductase [Corticibacterium sp. UT-5YL-CI-8]|nr:SDR family NAD(P)-dependent oxidoreductase [Tianweitania sp. UT-5YL-CI-8]
MPRVAIVTGGSRGIGRAIIDRLLSAGHSVVNLDRVAGETGNGAEERLTFRAVDLSQPEEVAAAALAVLADFGPITVLVNNAGISPVSEGRGLPVESLPLAEWRNVFAVNLDAAFLLSQALIPSMRQASWGRIVNMSSQSARTVSSVTGAHYGASKMGMISLTRSLAAELGPYGITSNCIAPGWTDTSLGTSFTGIEPYLARTPLRRLGRPEDIAAAVAFLVSDEAAYITGATLDVNGGSFMG